MMVIETRVSVSLVGNILSGSIKWLEALAAR